jgi:PTS system fructose-specific IIC component/PTS system nitrogen regulatory IIA component
MSGIRLQDIFQTDRIRLHLEATEKDGVFEELVDFLITTCHVTGRDDMLKLLRERENKMSTGLFRGIAVPHGKIDAIGSIVGVLGISDKGIDYDALDKTPVHLVFLFLSDRNNTQGHLELLTRISGIAGRPAFFDEIRKANTPLSAHQIIIEYEQKLKKND